MLKRLILGLIFVGTFISLPAFAHFHQDCNDADVSNSAKTALCKYLDGLGEADKQVAATLSMKCVSKDDDKSGRVDRCALESDSVFFVCVLGLGTESCEHGKYMSKEESARTWQYKRRLTTPRNFGISGQDAIQAFNNHLLSVHCSDGLGKVRTMIGTSIQIQCTNAKVSGAPDIAKEWDIALCHGYCVQDGKEFKKIKDHSITATFMCECKKASKQKQGKKQPETRTPIPKASVTTATTSTQEKKADDVVTSSASGTPAAGAVSTSESAPVSTKPEFVAPTVTEAPVSVTKSAPVSVPTEIHGRIVDDTNEGLIGANVRVDGTSQVTITDANGDFAIKPESSATSITVSYIGMRSQTIPIDNVPEQITMVPDARALTGVNISACSDAALGKLNASNGRVVNDKCIPTECKDGYELANKKTETDEDGNELIVAAECINTKGTPCNPMPANAAIATMENGKCVIKKCNEPRYKLDNGACIDQVGRDCRDKVPHSVTAAYEMDGGKLKCIVSKCDEPAWVPNDKRTKCQAAEGSCTDAQLKAVAHALSGSLHKGECVITECEKGWHVSKDGKKCDQAKLSEEDSLKKIDELEANADAMHDKEQSAANRALTAAAVLATATGEQQLMQGMAEKAADENAERDMKAYLATFACDYGQGRNTKGGDVNIELPGGNDMIEIVSEYKALAADLKARKDALGMQPGIESEVILDKSETGLYNNAAVGKTSSVYTSVARALTDENSADAAEWAKQKADAAQNVKTGGTVAAVGAIGGTVGNLAINTGKNAKKNQVNEINNRYDKKKQEEKEDKAE